MNAITFAVRKKSGDHIKVSVGPANRSEETRFGPIDLCILVFFLLAAGGLAWLLLLS